MIQNSMNAELVVYRHDDGAPYEGFVTAGYECSAGSLRTECRGRHSATKECLLALKGGSHR